jgi:hypothetical protein
MSAAAHHPTLESLRASLSEKGVTLACTVCGTAEFRVEEATIRGRAHSVYYGYTQLQRTQLVCNHCGHVMSFEHEADAGR